MGNLFVLDGASGTGKSDLVTYLLEQGVALVIKKLTTRRMRAGKTEEGLDLLFVSELEFEEAQPEYQYRYPLVDSITRGESPPECKGRSSRYGFKRSTVLEALNTGRDTLVIVRNVIVIERLIADFAEHNVIPVFVYTDREFIRQRIADRTEEEIEYRLGSVAIDFRNYLDNPSLYRDVLINSSTREDYQRLIQALVVKHQGCA